MDTAKLFMSGNSQAVRLPKRYRFSGDEVAIERLGNAVGLLPKEDPWQVMFDALQEFPEDLQIERDRSLPMEREMLCPHAPTYSNKIILLLAKKGYGSAVSLRLGVDLEGAIAMILTRTNKYFWIFLVGTQHCCVLKLQKLQHTQIK